MRSPALRGIVLLGLVLTTVCLAVPAPRSVPIQAGVEVFRQTLPGIVLVHAPGNGRGSGWVVDRARRLVVTCYHVVGDGDTCEVLFPWRENGKLMGPRSAYLERLPELRQRGLAVSGRVIRREANLDLALVEVDRLPATARALPLAEEVAQPGQRVHVLGNRHDLDVLWGYTCGSVCAVRRLREGYFTAGRQLARGAKLLLVRVPINEGDSGGPLLDDQGRVVGVSAAVAWRSQGAGLFIDLAELRRFLHQPTGSVVREQSVYRKALPAVALVEYPGGGRFAGVLIDRGQRLVLTSAEAVAREKTVAVTFPVEQPSGLFEAAWYRTQQDLLRRKGATSPAIVLAVDRRRNLALLEVGAVPSGAAELRLGATPQPGQFLHLISHPARLEVLWVYGPAWLRQLGQANLGGENAAPEPAVLFLQAALHESEGGGPVVDDAGMLVGLASGKVAAQQQIAYAIAPGEIEAFLRSVRPMSHPNSAEEYVQQGRWFLEGRQFARAETAFTAALTRAPRLVPALVGRAEARNGMGHHAQALADSEAAQQIVPQQAEAWCQRALAWLGLDQPERAVSDCGTALRIQVRCAPAYALRAAARVRLGDPLRAVDDASEALWLDGKLALAYRVRGQALALRGELVRAAADLGMAVRLAPDDLEAFRLRGDVAWTQSDLDAALADYEEVLKVRPDDATARHGRGRVRAARGDHLGALADLDAALRVAPNRVEVRIDRGGVKLARGLYRQAAADLVDAVRLAPQRMRAILAELERRTANLPGGDRDEQAGCILVCEAVLRAALQVPRTAAWRRDLDQGLEHCSKEKEPGAQARMLRRLVLRMAAAWDEPIRQSR